MIPPLLILLTAACKESVLVHDKEFSMSQLEAERSRITNLLKNNGYYKFSQESISFVIDTLEQDRSSKCRYNPFASAVTSIEEQKKAKKPPLDVNIIIRAEDPTEYRKYYINNSHRTVPDYEDRKDMRDSTMIIKNIEGTMACATIITMYAQE